LRPPFKIHGGKHYLNKFVLEQFPKNYEEYSYIEPFCGATSVFLNKNKSLKEEVINDIDDGIVDIFRALRDCPKTFIKKIKRKKYSERVFTIALNKEKSQEVESSFDNAINEFILRRMSRGGLKKNFSWSNRLRGGVPGDVNAWLTIIDKLPEISERIQETYIFNKDYKEVIDAFNNKDSLVYCDPPYVSETRVSKEAYKHEMTTDDHIDLANLLNRFKGKALISGYPSRLYNRLYSDWRCVRKKIVNHASQQKSKKYQTECLWINY
jgi:DNA adenine methylase